MGGHQIHFLCSGAGSPIVVVVEVGLGDFSTDWSLVQSQVAAFSRICVYDRAGYIWSEPGPMPRTYSQLNLEPHEGLKALGEREPSSLSVIPSVARLSTTILRYIPRKSQASSWSTPSTKSSTSPWDPSTPASFANPPPADQSPRLACKSAKRRNYKDRAAFH
jgi:hypothetical protein